MHKIVKSAAVSLALGLAATLGLAAPAAAAPRAYSDCPSGNVCFYTEQNGGGSRCQWDLDDPDWTTGTYKCSWATTSIVRSIFNNGKSTKLVGVAYYSAANYSSRMGCTRQGAAGNLSGTYKLRSHKWLANGSTCG